MIISGGSRSNGGFFTQHLKNDRDNERAELCEMRGLAAGNADDGFREMAAVASGTRCKNYFYHANINPRDHEHLTPEQWGQAIDALEKNLGLSGQPRMVFEHEKQGRIHRHVIWGRIDIDTMTARSDSQTAKIHERTSRELEERFGLERGQSVLEPGREGKRERGPQSWENFRGGKSGIDPREIKAELSDLWRTTDNGKAFVASVTERGYVVAQGDRRDFCIVDHAGDVHSLARRLEGVRAAEVRERMADVDRDSLPNAEEARVAQQARHLVDGRFDRDLAAQAWENRVNDAGIAHDAAQRQQEPERAPEPIVEERAAPAPEIGRNDAPEIGRSSPIDAGIQVMDGGARVIGKLADIVADILTLGAGSPTPGQMPKRQTGPEQRQERERATVALQNIRDSMDRGQGLRMEDLKNLSQPHLQAIAARGDDALRAMIYRQENERSTLREWGRERDR